METLRFELAATRAARGSRQVALVGVVASGNLEVLVERGGPPERCSIVVNTAALGFAALWQAVTEDFAARRNTGGLQLTVNDGGARPDTVSLRLAQAVRLIEEPLP